MSQPTIKDVAKLAGVSISTVSRVMNNSKPVSREARRRVEEAIKKLDFKPNELARSLVMKKSNSIGVLVKDIGIEYMAEIIRGIEEIGKMYQFNILLTSTYGDLENSKKSVDFLYRKQVEGIIILSEDINQEVLLKISEYKIPYIQLDKFYKANDYHTVTVDFNKAIQSMVDYLVGLGHRDIAYVSENVKYEIAENKLNGYKAAIARNKLKEYVIVTDAEENELGMKAMDKIVKDKIGVSAIIFHDDMAAIKAISYCYDHDIKVPDKYSITGFGDSKFANLYRPRLTTIVEPFYDIGAVAMRWLIKYLNKDDKMDETIYLPTQIRERESTKKIS